MASFRLSSVALLCGFTLLGLCAFSCITSADEVASDQLINELPPPPHIEPPTELAFLTSAAFQSHKELYIALISREAHIQGMPPEVALAVVHIESRYDPTKTGGVGEIGLMQVRPATAAMLGFRGSKDELFDPATNVRFGVLYLSRAWRLAEGRLCDALMKYRAGHASRTMTLRSMEYCRRARLHLAASGSPLAHAPLPERVALSSSRRKVAIGKSTQQQATAY